MLYTNHEGHEVLGLPIDTKTIWLQSRWEFDGKSQYAYSFDGIQFTDVAACYQLQWGAYRGDRFGMYGFNNVRESGFVDVNWIRYDFDRNSGTMKS